MVNYTCSHLHYHTSNRSDNFKTETALIDLMSINVSDWFIVHIYTHGRIISEELEKLAQVCSDGISVSVV